MCPPASDTPATTQGQQGEPTTVPDCIPTDSLSQSAYTYAFQQLQPTILNHSIRVYLYAKAISDREQDSWAATGRLPHLFAACILHDLGSTATHDGPQRFEVEGADAAADFLRRNGVIERAVHEVWVAIALHTSPGIAERISPMARLVRLGVTIDFKRPASLELTNDAEVSDFEQRFPRTDIEKVLGDAVVEQAIRRPEKAPAASWPGILLRSAKENTDWEGVNKAFCTRNRLVQLAYYYRDLIRRSKESPRVTRAQPECSRPHTHC